MKKREKTITNSMQEVAVDILIDIITEEYRGEPLKKEFFDRIMERYNLCEDPFTHLPCTSKEYGKLQKEYYDQLKDKRAIFRCNCGGTVWEDLTMVLDDYYSPRHKAVCDKCGLDISCRDFWGYE